MRWHREGLERLLRFSFLRLRSRWHGPTLPFIWDRGRPYDLAPPTPPHERVTYAAVRQIESCGCRSVEEPWQSKRVEVASRQRDGQRRTATEPPRAVRRFERVPSQIDADPAPTQFPVATPTPLFPEVAA